jgi:hypothetical protein
MLDKQVFDALCDSQESKKILRLRLTRKPLEDQHEWSDALSDVILGAYRDADDREDLIGHLSYCVRELQAAAQAVRQLEDSNVPHV